MKKERDQSSNKYVDIRVVKTKGWEDYERPVVASNSSKIISIASSCLNESE